ncbi:MAG: ArsR/SmtB family transcription factor [Candidatus Dormibacteraceae bacterium]
MISESKVGDQKLHACRVEEARATQLDRRTYERLAATFGALADPTRARVVHLLLERELCTADLAVVVGVSEPAVSQHLKVLRGLGLVRARREGRFVYYRLDDDHVAQLVRTSLTHLAEEGEARLERGGRRDG